MLNPVFCQFCQQPVILETARINEFGKAVHEECYLKAIQASRGSENDKNPETDA